MSFYLKSGLSRIDSQSSLKRYEKKVQLLIHIMKLLSQNFLQISVPTTSA